SVIPSMKKFRNFAIPQFRNSNSVTPARSRAGVTLLEIILAIAILGVISVAVAVVFNTGINLWKAGTVLADETRSADAVLEQIAMALRSSYYPEVRSPTYEYGFQHEDDGDSPRASDSISWVKIGNSLIGEDVPWAGVAHRTVLFMGGASAAEGPGLYVKAWQFAGQSEDFDPDTDVSPLLLSDQIVSLDVKMRDPEYTEIAGSPYEWLDKWDLSNRIPTHVLVTIAVNAPNEKDPPVEFSRMIDIPMADLSWNPIQTTGGGRNANRSRNASPSGPQRGNQPGANRPGTGNQPGGGRPGGNTQPGGGRTPFGGGGAQPQPRPNTQTQPRTPTPRR
ncbi:MAG: prepilin-type N-terminal cleavage/methylation domain-containing protein, partial [Kiritimatiellaeota bacterium]|nr:prepilin-type N-terminal cleavage/methylation domain-containing protein [Kiritimatiellota bacterium]